MLSDEDTSSDEVPKLPEEPAPRRRPKKLKFPRRTPSVVVPPRKIIYITADKTTCTECTCYPPEDPYVKPKKLNPCLKSPKTLYELAAAVVDGFIFPKAFDWSVWEVAMWMEIGVGLPQYKKCILDNHINGKRLLLLEDPSCMPLINIHYHEHIKRINVKIRELFGTEFIKFSRSIGLPPRYPYTYCTWFKSRTGPTWGIRQNWSSTDILRWMKILMPAPIYLDHWDLVWYHKPDFPKVKFARVPKPISQVHIPHYTPTIEICNEYLAPRKFRVDRTIPASQQFIWMEHRPCSATDLKKKVVEKKKKVTIPQKSRLDPKKVNTKGLAGNDLILARRKMPKKKFLA